MRYYDGLSQAEIARRLSISQMHVSRIQRDALKRLRAMIEA
ncbi:MAG: helix-turn-helix domain-containing protein [Armatimonadetes bacterium]|nr:helix-turn-helix domain-containing protein [Armatimonadota bacterium]